MGAGLIWGGAEEGVIGWLFRGGMGYAEGGREVWSWESGMYKGGSLRGVSLKLKLDTTLEASRIEASQFFWG